MRIRFDKSKRWPVSWAGSSLILGCLLFPLFAAAQQSYQDWLKKDQQAYRKFLEKEDRDFMDFLKKDWKAFQSMQGKRRDVKPKPKKLPLAQPSAKPVQPAPAKAPVKVKPIPPVKKLPPPPKPAPQANIRFTYFGVPVAFLLEKTPEFALPAEIKNEVISQAWGAIAASPAVSVVSQLEKEAKSLRLNDWGYLLLTHDLSRTLYKSNPDQQILMTWFLLVKSGWDARIAYKRDQIFLLLPSQNTVYNNQFVTLSGEKYYFINFNGKADLSGQVYTYEGNYKGSNSKINLSLSAVPNLTNEIDNKKLQFNFMGKPYSFNVKYDKDVVDFFQEYPQTEIGLYFKPAVSENARITLLAELKPQLSGKSEVQAVNFLLRFVQTAFDYKTDDEQFGREKYLLPEETIFYPSSDCEDRSILFSYLVRNLLGLEIVGLDYPGHIATAIRFTDKVEGDFVSENGKKYVICDPTFINADAGMCMPDFKKIKPEIIYF